MRGDRRSSRRRPDMTDMKRIPAATALTMVCAAALILAAAACGSSEDAVEMEAVVLEVTVGAELQDCVGLGPRQCMVVDGELFYEGIDGFDYERGYVYRLKMERYDAWPGEEEPPQDASRYGYRLVEVIEKVRAP